MLVYMPTYAADLDAIREAAARIVPYAHRTPVLTSATLDQRAERELYFKCEIFQKVGAFKFRGACNAVMKLPDELARHGVVTHSSGNHAQALALAASLRGIAAHIVMPRNAPRVKRDAVAGYGAKIYLCEPNLKSRLTMTNEVVEETGAVLIPPYDHPDIIAGQGTIALELLEQVPDLDAIVVPVGGGGMTSGICIAGHGLKPSLRIFAAEPKGADDVARSFAEGRLIEQTSPNTIADGLLTSLCDITWSIIRDHVERVVTVSDEATVDAMRLVMERMKIVIEPSAGVGVAAALSEEFRSLEGMRKVGVILCGGNLDLDRLPWTSARTD